MVGSFASQQGTRPQGGVSIFLVGSLWVHPLLQTDDTRRPECKGGGVPVSVDVVD